MALWRIRATVDDRPGYLSVLTASLALRGVNILTVQVHTTEAGAVDDFLVDAPPAITAADLIAAVERGRGRDCWVARSEARGLVDQPTRALALASRLVHDPDALGETLRALLGADAVTWRPTAIPAPPSTSTPASGAPPAPRQRPAGAGRRERPMETMHLLDPSGGSFEIRRAAPSFTPAEYARAQALVDLATNVTRRAAEQVTLLLPDGAELLLRPATTDDLPAVVAMHDRCSARSRRRRYPATDGQPGADRLRHLLDPARGMTLVALLADGAPGPVPDCGGRVVAMATLVTEGVTGEVAVLVEDAWQRRGLGGALLRRLVSYADGVGYAALVAHTHADDPALRRALDRLRRPGSLHRDGAMVTVTVPLSGTGGPDAPTPPAMPHSTPAVHET